MNSTINAINLARTRAQDQLTDTLESIDKLTILFNTTKNKKEKIQTQQLIEKLNRKVTRLEDKARHLQGQLEVLTKALTG